MRDDLCMVLHEQKHFDARQVNFVLRIGKLLLFSVQMGTNAEHTLGDTEPQEMKHSKTTAWACVCVCVCVCVVLGGWVFGLFACLRRVPCFDVGLERLVAVSGLRFEFLNLGQRGLFGGGHGLHVGRHLTCDRATHTHTHTEAASERRSLDSTGRLPSQR